MRLTKTLIKETGVCKGGERFLLCWMRKISDIVAGQESFDIKRNSLIKSLAIIQNENKLEEIDNAERWIKEIELHISLLRKNLNKARAEIKMLIKK